MFLDTSDANRLRGDTFVADLQARYAVPADQRVAPPDKGDATRPRSLSSHTSDCWHIHGIARQEESMTMQQLW